MRNDSAPAVYSSNINGDICMTDTYFATCKIGLESVVAGELRDLGIEVLRVSDARVDFAGDHFAMARACLWLRTAELLMNCTRACAAFAGRTTCCAQVLSM